MGAKPSTTTRQKEEIMPKYISQTKETYNRNKHSVKGKLNLKNTRIGEHWSSVLDRKLDHLNKSELISLVQSQAIIIARTRRDYNLSKRLGLVRADL